MKETFYFKTYNKEINYEFFVLAGFSLKLGIMVMMNYSEKSGKMVDDIVFWTFILGIGSLYYLLYFLIGDYK